MIDLFFSLSVLALALSSLVVFVLECREDRVIRGKPME